ncbi:MAG: hypothetical protein HQL39_16185 [Alphaproteobacteria bacterium]|nr:hypothetical protein [Alphaproteobacteria bacterium]
MPPCPACEIPAGHLVDAAVGGAVALCLKAERAGKGHVNHYLVPLEPLDGGLRAMRLVYVDPDSPVERRSGALIVGPLAEGAAAPAQVGDVLVTEAGEVFLKVLDDEQSQRLWAYVDLASGQVRRRRERHAAGLRAWRLEITAPAGS